MSGGTLAWGVLLWQRGLITAGDVVVCGAFTLALLQASRDLAVALVEMSHHWSRVTEAIGTLMVAHDFPDAAAAAPPAAHRGAIALDGIAFRHGSGEPILRDIDLRIRAGERVGVVGPSGAGKSTLLAVIEGLYRVERGRILIDGCDVDTLTRESIRRAIAVVPQEISLFHRSILENIRYGRPDASDADVATAARAACCEEFIADLPEDRNPRRRARHAALGRPETAHRHRPGTPRPHADHSPR